MKFKYTYFTSMEWISDNILYSTGKSSQQLVITNVGKIMGTFICMTDSVCFIPETNTTF